MTSNLPILFLIIFTILTPISTKLYQVVSLFRHGARYHVNQFADGSDTKPLWGELTAVGMRQHQKFGQLLRKQYIDNLKFISPTYTPSQIEIYSTPVNRTILSALSQFYGLYPPGTGPRITFIDRKYHLPPYSTNKTNIAEQNYALPNAHQPVKVKLNAKIMLGDCPNYGKYSNLNLQTNKEAVNEMGIVYAPFIKKLSTMFNFSYQTATMYTMLRVYDAVNVDLSLGRPLPQNFTEDDQKNVHHLADWYMNVAQMNNVSLMYTSGKMQKILNAFDLRTKLPETYQLKWTFLSGHDTDIVAMYLGMNLSSYNCIEQVYRKGKTSSLNCLNGANTFAASLIFELHSDDNGKSFYVKVKSDGKYVNLCEKASTSCDYSIFKATYKKLVVSNLADICGKPIKDFDAEMRNFDSMELGNNAQPVIVTEI